MRRILGYTTAAAAGLLLTLGVALPATADTSDFTFDSFDADYTLSIANDGGSHLDVVETIVARFPEYDQNRGIIRAIPNEYNGSSLRTSVKTVVDENGAPVNYEVALVDGFYELALGTDDYVHGPTTYVISYSQERVVQTFPNTGTEEFYWDVNGTGWGQPFGRVSMKLNVDPAIADSLTGDAACYVGAYGDTEDCRITNLSATVQDLEPGETLTVAIGFEPGTFVTPEPGPSTRPVPVGPIEHLIAGGIGLASLGGLAGSIAVRARAARAGAKGRGVVVAQYSEPAGITILQSTHLVGRGATAIPAAVVRLAVRKNLRLLAYTVVEDGEPYSLQYLTDAGASAEDLALLDILFGTTRTAGEVRGFGASDRSLMESLTGLSALAKGSLTTAGFRAEAPGKGPAALLLVLQVVLGVVAIVALTTSLGMYQNVSGLLIAVMVVGSLIFIATAILAWLPANDTERGALAREHLEGLQLYLTVAEQERLRFLQSPSGAERIDVSDNVQLVKLYEKLLPWAVVWGVEDEWMRELAVRVEALPEEPDWIVGTDGFTPTLFNSTLGGIRTMTTPIATTSSWSGSSGASFSGGSFGGGFSGGGGGGGGGGGR